MTSARPHGNCLGARRRIPFSPRYDYTIWCGVDFTIEYSWGLERIVADKREILMDVMAERAAALVLNDPSAGNWQYFFRCAVVANRAMDAPKKFAVESVKAAAAALARERGLKITQPRITTLMLSKMSIAPPAGFRGKPRKLLFEGRLIDAE